MTSKEHTSNGEQFVIIIKLGYIINIKEKGKNKLLYYKKRKIDS